MFQLVRYKAAWELSFCDFEKYLLRKKHPKWIISIIPISRKAVCRFLFDVEGEEKGKICAREEASPFLPRASKFTISLPFERQTMQSCNLHQSVNCTVHCKGVHRGHDLSPPVNCGKFYPPTTGDKKTMRPEFQVPFFVPPTYQWLTNGTSRWLNKPPFTHSGLYSID